MLGLIRHRLASTPNPSLSLEQGIRVVASRAFASSGNQMTVRDALNSALDEEMAADPKVFVMGEEPWYQENQVITWRRLQWFLSGF